MRALVSALTSYEVSFLLLPMQSKKENATKEKKEKKEKKDTDKVWEPPKERWRQRQDKDTTRHLEIGGSFKNT